MQLVDLPPNFPCIFQFSARIRLNQSLKKLICSATAKDDPNVEYSMSSKQYVIKSKNLVS